MKTLDPFEVSFSGVHLIEASAGTGKTYNIASLYVRALIETPKTVDEILVVTYTEAATKELRDRLMKRLRESIRVLEGTPTGDDSFLAKLQKDVVDADDALKKLKQAVRSFDEAAVYTIHGFCGHALQEWAFESGASFDATLIGDDTEIIAELIDDYWRNTVRKFSENPLRRPLLKLLLDKNYGPEKIIKELSDYVGKPYLKILPEEEVSLAHFDESLYRLRELYDDLKSNWDDQEEQLLALLESEQMHGNKYRKNSLPKWANLMSHWMRGEVAPVAFFDQFEKFAQSTINESLKKSASDPPPEHPFFKQVDRYIETARSVRNFDVAFKRKLFADIVEEVNDRKEELQVYSYDDMLIQLRNAVLDPQGGRQLRKNIRNSYPIALVDEFQDTDPIQYQIFKSIYGKESGSALFMIGDPKQSIYGFRGADIFAYLQAKTDAPAENSYNLGHNYRSVPSLIEGVNALFSSHSNPFILENIPFRPVEAGRKASKLLTIDGTEAAPLEIRQLLVSSENAPLKKGTANKCTAADTAAQIHKLLADAQKGAAKIGEKPVQARDIAVLVRKHPQAKSISDALKERGIKSVTRSRESVFKSEEAAELYAVLKAVIKPTDDWLVMTALSTSVLGYKANELFVLQQDEKARAEIVEKFVGWHAMWQQHGFGYMFRMMMQQQEVAETVMQLKHGERILTNIIHLVELIRSQEQNGKSGMHSLLKWLLKKRNEDGKDIEEEQLRLESDENLVNIVTIHQSKGLEYPIVFCPYLWYVRKNDDEGKPIVYHEPGEKSTTYLDFQGKNDPGRPQKRYQNAKEELAEEVRLAYVAITRAQYKCVINWVHAKKAAHSPFGFLLLDQKKAFESLGASIFPEQTFDESDPLLFKSAIEQLSAHDSIIAPVVDAGQIEPGTFESDSEGEALEAKTFDRKLPLPAGHRMTSFSSLVRSEQNDFEPDYHNYFDDQFERVEEPDEFGDSTIFDFPKGPKPGTAVHHIFENIDFADERSWEDVINEQLAAQNIAERWISTAKSMLQKTVSKSLLADKPELKLAALKPEHMIAELEFYFASDHVQLNELLHIIRPNEKILQPVEGFAEEGYLKGFIDLTFKYNNRYYILDYKTNHLGGTIADYRPEMLQEEMHEAFYNLQYHIYCVALHRFLSSRMQDYSYKAHFGGAFYLFLRGINNDGGEGIYFDRPDESIITKLDNYLGRDSG